MIALGNRLTRLVWFNSILEATTLSDDHLDYIQQLINLAVSPSPSASNSPTPSSSTLPFLATNSVIPELLVFLAKGDYLQIYLHSAIYPLLTLLSNQYNHLISVVKRDPSAGLRSNLINVFANTIYEWLCLDLPTEKAPENKQNHIDENISSYTDQNDTIHTAHDEKQCLVIILGIASLHLFSQVNYAGLPLVIPYSRDQYKSNTTDVITPSIPLSIQSTTNTDIIDTTETTTQTTVLESSPTLQQSTNLFFDLFSQRSISDFNDSKDVLLLTSPQYQKNTSKNRQFNVHKSILLNSALKLNGEDTYQCSYFPLFLIIARSIFGCEQAFSNVFQTILPKYTTSTRNTNTSVFSLITQKHFIPLAHTTTSLSSSSSTTITPSSTGLINIPPQFAYFASPALLHYIIRSIKLHMEILLTPIASIRTEYYTISILYQILYGVLCSNTTFQNCHLICSEFKCIPFHPFHTLISPFTQVSQGGQGIQCIRIQGNQNNSNQETPFHTIASAFARLIAYLPNIQYIDLLSGEDFTAAGSKKSKMNTNAQGKANALVDLYSDEILDSNQFNSILLTTYNALAQPPLHTSISTSGVLGTGTGQIIDSAIPSQPSAQMEHNIDDMHAVGISPLTHKHLHTTYTPLTFLSPTSSTKPATIPITLATTLLSTITIELAHIALKLYAYKRSFLLLSLAKIFSGVCIFVSGVLGRRTRYQVRSFAQLHGTSFIHKDIINQITKDAVSAIKFHHVDSTNSASVPTSLPSFDPINSKYLICPDITDTLIAPYIVKTNDINTLRPQLEEEDEKTKEEKNNYKGVINQRNATIPRISTLSSSNIVLDTQGNFSTSIEIDNNGQKAIKKPYTLCITKGGHVEDVPINSVDDLYLTYMLPDQDNYSVDEEKRKKELRAAFALQKNENGERGDVENDENNSKFDDEVPPMVVQAGDSLEGIAGLLYQAAGTGGLVFEPNCEDLDTDAANQADLQQIEPPLDSFLPYYQTTIGSLLSLSVASYLYETCPQSEITQQEQDCYLQSIFMHKYNQGTCYTESDKNKHGNIYNNYTDLYEYNMLSTPYATILQSLMLRSSLEYTNSRLQIRAISQIELLSNIYVGHEEKLRQIHFQPTLLPDVIQLYHNIGIDHTKYDTGIKQVTKTESMLTFLYDGIDLPHHRYKLDHPVEYNAILTKTIRNVTRFRMNKIYTSCSAPWWEILRTCADICTKIGFISTALRCLVNVQLWSNVVDTLIQIGRRGDATKLLKRVLKIPKDMKPNELLEEARKVHVTEADRASLGGFTQFESSKGGEQIDNANWGLMFKDKEDIAQEHIAQKLAQNESIEDYGVDLDDIDEGSNNHIIVIDKEAGGQPEGSSVSSPSSSSLIKIAPTELDALATPPTDVKKTDDEEDPDYHDGSLLSFVAKSMEATVHTTTTTSGLSTLSASSYRLYHLLGESTQEPTYWDISWELSHQTYAPPQRSIAKWYAVRKFDEKSYECYKNALDLNGSDHQTWYECGVVATRLQWYDKAISAFSNALRIKPDISEGWNNLAACHLYLSNISSAYHALSQCLRTRRSSWKIWENYLQCSLQLGHYNEVLTSLVHISELKGKIDPMTLMPIQYTTDQSKLHVFALYATWFEYLEPQTKNEITFYNSIQPGLNTNKTKNNTLMGPTLPSTDVGNINNTHVNVHEHSDHDSFDLACNLCIQHPTENVASGVELNAAVLFPLVHNFQRAVQAILINITHNESREREMGGKISGGGDDSGAANSFSAQLDQLRHQQAYQKAQDDKASQIDDDNALDISLSTTTPKHSTDQITAETFMQALSESSKGQRSILQYLLGLSHKLVAVSGDLVSLQQSSNEFEGCITTLLKLCQDDAYHKSHLYHIEFILMNFELIFTNARMCDTHVLHHFSYEYTYLNGYIDGQNLTLDEMKAKISRNDANAKDMLLLLCNRILDNWKRDYTNNKLNLAHILPYIEQLEQIVAEVKNEINLDDAFWKANFSSTEITSSDLSNNFEYDPYGSFY